MGRRGGVTRIQACWAGEAMMGIFGEMEERFSLESRVSGEVILPFGALLVLDALGLNIILRGTEVLFASQFVFVEHTRQ
jgi:hypothetical protein